MEKQILIQKYINLVQLTEEYISTGFRTGHMELGEIPGKQMKAEKTDIPRDKQLELLKQKILICKNCSLHYNRVNAIPGEGSLDADLFIVGKSPDEEEDAAGRPFTGSAGEYFQKWLAAIQLTIADHCFTCNIVRCRPPQNRDPGVEETRTCFSYINDQITIVNPKVILCLGRIPGQMLTGKLITSVARLRGQPFSFNGIPLVVTYHPAFVLQDQSYRKPVWEDLKRVKRIIEKRAAEG